MPHEVGEETLHRIARMPAFNRWTFEVIEPYLGLRVLEVGCGIGNLTRLIAPERHVFVLDIEPEYVAWVLKHKEEIHGLSLRGEVGDICQPLPKEVFGFRPDTVICLNVLEHLADEKAATEHMFNALQPGGVLVLLVPAFPSLYGSLDKALGHYRRYSKKDLLCLAKWIGAKTEKIFFMNLFGIPGWWFSGKILRRRLLPRKMLDLYQVMAPLFRLIERVTGPPLGLSHVAVFRKQ